MNKKNLIILSFYCISIYSFAQDINISAKSEITRILKDYFTCLNTLSDTALKPENRKTAFASLKTDLEATDIFVWNESSGKDNEFLQMSKYLGAYPKKLKISVSLGTISKIIPNKEKNCLTCEAQVVKTVIPYHFSGKDTVFSPSKSFNLTFYFRLTNEANIAKNVQFYAIAKTGTPAKFKPLSDAIQWWSTMDENWKKIFMDLTGSSTMPSEAEIQRMQYLMEIKIIGNPLITNLNPLSKLTDLRKLECQNTNITSLEALKTCVNLQELDISNTKVTDISPLSKLLLLRKLNFSKTGVVSIAPLRECVELEELYCTETKVIDISAMQNLVKMRKFNCSLNNILSIDSLKNCTKMTDLRFGKSMIKNIEPLRGMTDLVRLDCFSSEISSLDPIRNCFKMAFLYFDACPVTSLEPLSRMNFLSEIGASKTKINDLTPLQGKSTLKSLIINNSEVSSLAPISKLPYLSELKIHYTKISKSEAGSFKKDHPGMKITYY